MNATCKDCNGVLVADGIYNWLDGLFYCPTCTKKSEEVQA